SSDWQNFGGSLASEPVAVSWGPDRLDVFAIFRDGALWHKWWDGQIWNEWESLGGSSSTGGTFIGSPSAVSWSKDRLDVFAVGGDGLVYHFWWSAQTWAGPELLNSPPMTSGPTAISIAPNRLDVFAPGSNLNPQPDVPAQYVIYHKAFNVSAWQPANWFEALGGRIRLPSRYRFSVDYVTAHNTRSLNADTDTASASIASGNWPTRTKTQAMGDVGGTHPSQAQLNLLHFDPVTVELCEASSFNYLVVNNGHADQKSLDDAMVKAAGSLSDDSVKSVATELGAGVGAIVSVELAGSIAAPVIGSLLGAVAGWLMDQLGSVVFQNCDGLVAAELIVLFGRDLDLKTAHGPYTVKTVHPGTDSGIGCGANSNYEVTWTISRI
ncbi:MAG: hypothetical protein M3Z36_12030, partial [Acidobacteriota bacterium]|nr:hypothetical protein [Acidobacteriota bacterium]